MVTVDLLVIGGGVNGAGIARDAAGRGLSVMLVEQGDLAGATSSASTKLIHGGLRYLEHYAFRLVGEALRERGRILAIAPHIAWPMRFVLPLEPVGMGGGGGRPRWLVRAGLHLYDALGGWGPLPASRSADLTGPLGAGLQPRLTRGFVYSDGWIDDARLVVLNAVSAREYGADIRTRTRFVSARPAGAVWHARIEGGDGAQTTVAARAIVNAAGPFVGAVRAMLTGVTGPAPVRLVKGSHIVVPRLFAGDHAYIFQNADGRVLFAIPYEHDFTLIGTTDVAVDDPAAPVIADAEIAYLCAAASRCLARPVRRRDIVHSFSGIRPLFDDGAAAAADVTRDYVLALEDRATPPLLTIYGGKITTYRRLAEHALARLARPLGTAAGRWTGRVPLPGGAFDAIGTLTAALAARYPFLDPGTRLRIGRAYGTRAFAWLGDAGTAAALGQAFGFGLSAAEVDWLMAQEWARTADDVLWRRTKLGLRFGAAEVAALDAYMRKAQVAA